MRFLSPPAAAALSAALLVLLVAVAARAELFEACGYIAQSSEGCNVLYETEAHRATTLMTLPAGTYDRQAIYRVTGDLAECDSLCGITHWQRCLTVTSVTPCLPESLGCGILGSSLCSYWDSPRYGIMELTDFDFGGFAPGDTVEAVGLLDRVSYSLCMIGPGHLRNYTFRRCPTALVPVRMTTWGHLKAIYR